MIVNVNGLVITADPGDLVVTSNGETFINGKKVDLKGITPLPGNRFEIVVNGNVGSIKVDNGPVTVHGDVTGNVDSRNGEIKVGNVGGDVTTRNGKVSAATILGSVSTKYGNVRTRK